MKLDMNPEIPSDANRLEPEENLVRLISARLATAQERKAYEQNRLRP